MTLGLLALLVARPQIDDDWIWWWPPPTLSSAERQGYSTRSIARMSLHEWWKHGNKLPVEGPNDAYGYALRVETRREARSQFRKVQKSLEQVREASFRLGMACIALENELGGGGTWSNHAPHWMFVQSEQLNRDLLRRRPAQAVRQSDLAKASKIIERCQQLTSSRPTVLERPIDIARLHTAAERVVRYRRAFENLKRDFPPSARSHFDGFMIHWTTDYFSKRGSDKIILR